MPGYLEEMIENDEKVKFSTELVAELSYKKGWSFSVGLRGEIVIVARFEDVNDVSKKAMLTDSFSFSTEFLVTYGRERVLEGIYYRIVALERHEASEWFKVGGKAIFNEHDRGRI